MKPVIARADDSLIRLGMEMRPPYFLPKGEMTRSFFILTLEFPLEMMGKSSPLTQPSHA